MSHRLMKIDTSSMNTSNRSPGSLAYIEKNGKSHSRTEHKNNCFYLMQFHLQQLRSCQCQ